MPRLENFLICEDARIEISGLITLVGFFPGPLKISAPGHLPRIACVVTLKKMAGIADLQFQFEAKQGSDELVRLGPFRVKRPNPAQDNHAFVHVFPDFPVPRAGEYLITMTIDVDGAPITFAKRFFVEMQKAPASPAPLLPTTSGGKRN